MLACFLIIVALCAVGESLTKRFLIKKEVRSFSITTQNIAKNILDTERQIEERLKVSTILLEKYLSENHDLSRTNLINFTKLANVDRATLHSKDGKKALGSSSEILENPQMIEFMKTYNLLDRVVDPKKFLSANHNLVIFPMGRDTVTGVTSKPILRWSQKLNMIMSCAMEVSVSEIIKADVKLHPELTYISMSTPSGTIFADSLDSVKLKISPIEDYDENSKIVENNHNQIKLQLCFGGLQPENAIRIMDKTVNSKQQYFYVLNAVFSKKNLNKQLFFVKTIFIAIALLATLVSNTLILN